MMNLVWLASTNCSTHLNSITVSPKRMPLAPFTLSLGGRLLNSTSPPSCAVLSTGQILADLFG